MLEAFLETITIKQWISIIGLPICFILIGKFAKTLGKREGDDSPRINDWAVSTSVILMTFGKVSADLSEYLQKGTHNDVAIYWLVGIVLSIFVSIEHDRYRSWKLDINGKPLKEKRLFVGVVLPNLVSGIIFASYQLSKLI